MTTDHRSSHSANTPTPKPTQTPSVNTSDLANYSDRELQEMSLRLQVAKEGHLKTIKKWIIFFGVLIILGMIIYGIWYLAEGQY